MKIGCISWSHRNLIANGTMDIFSWIEHCKKDANLDGIEIWNNHFESIETSFLSKLNNKVAEVGLPIYSVATKCLFGDFKIEEIEKAKQTLRDWLMVADFLGSSFLRVSIGGNNLRNYQNRIIVFNALTDVLNEDKYPNVAVGIENQEPGVVQNVKDVELMVKQSNGKLRLVLDNGSFINKNDSYDFTEKTLKYAGVVHVKFFDVDENGRDKVLDYEKIAKIIIESGYNGFLSIEYDSQGPVTRDIPLITKYLRTLF